MTYASDRGYKVGDKFKFKPEKYTEYGWVTSYHNLNSFIDEFIFAEDDGSTCPYFCVEGSDKCFSVGLEDVEKVISVSSEYTYPKIKVGDWVKVVRKVDGHDKDGMAKGSEWQNSWDRDMDKCIGNNYRVISIDMEAGIRLDTSLLDFQYSFPLAALELVKDEGVKVTEPTKEDLSSKYVMHFNIEIDSLRELRDLLLEIETIKNRIFK